MSYVGFILVLQAAFLGPFIEPSYWFVYWPLLLFAALSVVATAERDAKEAKPANAAV